MIRLECFIEEKNVGNVMQRIAGLVKEPQWHPVVNVAKKPNGKLEQATNGDLVAMFDKWLQEKKIKGTNAAGARMFLESIGQPPGRASYLLQRAQAYGVIKKKPGGANKTAIYMVRKEKV